MSTILFNREEIARLSKIYLIPETRWNQGLQAKTGKPALSLQRSTWLRFLLKIYLESEISVRGSFRHLISQISKPFILFFSVLQDFGPQVIAIRVRSVFFPQPLTPKTLQRAIRNVPPKHPVSLEASI